MVKKIRDVDHSPLSPLPNLDSDYAETLAEFSAQLADQINPQMLALFETAEKVVDYAPQIVKSSPGQIISAKLPEEIVREMDEIVDDRRFGFRTRTDFVREAVHVFARILFHHYELKNPRLMRMILEREITAHLDEAKIYREQLYRSAVGLRNLLIEDIVAGHVGKAMLNLRGFYAQVRGLPEEEAEGYLRLLTDMPVCRAVAWQMRDWGDKIPDRYIPAEEPATDLGTLAGDEGLPPEPGNGKVGSGGGSELPPKFDKKSYMREYMRQRRNVKGND